MTSSSQPRTALTGTTAAPASAPAAPDAEAASDVDARLALALATAPLVAETDVLVVGAGIVGLAHAVLSRDAGRSVVVVDRDRRAVGASVRNFGHACITAQTGELAELADRARGAWLDVAARAGVWTIESGAVTVARSETELAVLRELAEHRRGTGDVEILDADATAAALGRGDRVGILGGAFLARDLRVDPRTTVAGIAAWLDSRDDASVAWGTSVLAVEEGRRRRVAVRTNRGTIEADRVFVCVGHDVDYLFPTIAQAHGLTRCALQMARSTTATAEPRIRPAVLTATSMLRYDAFVETPSAAALRAEIAAAAPELLDIGANVMFTQRPDGSFLLGDSHAYDLAHEPFLDEAVTDRLLAEARAVLGRPGLAVAERWQGVYASSDRGPLLVAEAADGVTVASVTAGVGMTVSFGFAARNVEAALGADLAALSASA